MNEQSFVATAIRIIGLWRIFVSGGDALYFVIAKDLGLRTTGVPVSNDLLSLGYELVIGIAIILSATSISKLICGRTAAEP
jgi:ABC-type uncharacterized transport system permease subunit